MFGKIKFRVITQHLERSVMGMKDLLRKEGFEIYDLRESDIVEDSDNSYVESTYILCCKGKKKEFERFKHKHQFDEINYEGFRTLM